MIELQEILSYSVSWEGLSLDSFSIVTEVIPVVETWAEDAH